MAAVIAAAKEQNSPSLSETRVWASGDFFPMRTRRSAPPSSTLAWGWRICSYEIAAERLVGKYFPYGQERPSATQDGKEKFATYFRDSETGLDYANNRYHQPGMGRFMTADPYRASGGAADPGSWNRYAYTRGDPVTRTDRNGLFDSDDDPTSYCDVYADDPHCDPMFDLENGPIGGGSDEQRGGRTGKPSWAALNRATNTLAQRFSFSSGCENGLSKLKLSSADLQNHAGDIAWSDGTGEGTQIQFLYADATVGAAAQAKYDNDYLPYRLAHGIDHLTLADLFAADPNIHVLTPPGGHFAYYNSTLDTRFADQNQGLLMHELLHEVWGMDDGDIADALGIRKDFNLYGSFVLTRWMTDHCVDGSGNK